MQSASSSVHYVEVYSVLYIQSFQMKASYTAGGIEIAFLGRKFMELTQ